MTADSTASSAALQGKGIGFRTIGYREVPPEEAILRIAEVGYDGIELCLEHPGLEPETLDYEYCGELARLASEAGTVLATISYHGDRDPLELRWRRALLAIEMAPAFGCDIVIINSPRPGPEAPADLEVHFYQQLAAQIERAEALGITLALEPEPGLLVHDCHDMLELMRRVGSPALRVNLDVGHAFLTEEDVAAAIAMLEDTIAAAHIEDIAGRRHRHLVPGTGEMDLAGILEALWATGFDGWLTVDLFDIADAPDEAAYASLRAMRSLIGTRPDAEAVQNA